MRLKFTPLVVLLVLLSNGACSRKPTLTIGSKSTIEQAIVAEIIAQHVEKRLGLPVVRKTNLGDTAAVFSGLMGGEIDLYPEYSGAAASTILNLSPTGNPGVLRERIRTESRNRLNVEWIAPLGFDAAYAIAIPGSLARENGFETIADVENDRSRTWRFAVTFEFFERPEYLKLFNRTYSIPFAAAIQAMERNQLPHSLSAGAADMVAVPRTLGGFVGADVKFLTDTKGMLPSMEAAIAVKREALQRFPGLEGALRELTGRIRPEAIQKLNRLAEVDQTPAGELARQFLGSGATNLSSMH
ncbi:MAG: hypothetical protein JNL98_12855 [Bryobacterales bacterium]|nr:hypothetical protein [Bryobacterales bacterium]